MKTRVLIIIGIFTVSIFGYAQYADAWCPENKDWPDAPCYAPYQITSGSLDDKIKEDWAKYYDYKGEYWMEQKRYELEQAMNNNSLEKWLDLDDSHRNVHNYYYLQGEVPGPDGNYVFTCNMYEDLIHYEAILKDDVILKKFLKVFPFATSAGVGGIDESRPPQTSIIYQYENHGVDASLLMRVFEGDDKEPCLVPRVYTMTYQSGSDITEIRNSNVDEILEFLESLSFEQSPLKQFRIGIPFDEIQCGENLVLIQKHDGTPACVKPGTSAKLVGRGWTTPVSEWPSLTPITPELGKFGTYGLEKDGIKFDIKYYIKGGSDIKEIIPDSKYNAISIILEPHDSGSLEITILRESIDAKISNGVDDLFFVLIDGKEVRYTEITNETSRTLTIQFEKDSKMIEIIGTVPI